MVSLCIVILAVGYLGSLFKAENTSYATTGSLISKNGVWYGDASDNGASMTIGWSGYYNITVTAGSEGGVSNTVPSSVGNITATAYLQKGDSLRFNWYQCGGVTTVTGSYNKNDNWHVRTNNVPKVGCNASLIWLNDLPLVGSGELPQINNNAFGCGTTYMFPRGLDSNSYGRVERDWYWDPASEVPEGFNLVEGPSYCYLDTSRATLSNISSVSPAISFRVEAIANTVDDSYDAQIAQANYQKQMVDYQRQMLDTFKCISEELEANDIPMITVCQNQDFNVTLAFYDDMPSGRSADNLITVTNSTIGDKVIKVSGRLPSKGVFSVDINGKTFIFKVLETPTTSNVTVILE